MGKRELVALLSLSSWCFMIVVWLFLAVPSVCLQFVIVVFPDHTHLIFFIPLYLKFCICLHKTIKYECALDIIHFLKETSTLMISMFYQK